MIRGIHYFSAEVKPKLMSSQGAALTHATGITEYDSNESAVLEGSEQDKKQNSAAYPNVR